MTHHAEKSEVEANELFEFRKAVGLPLEGYAHVHVANSIEPTPSVFVVLPGGTMMNVGGDVDQLIARKRADFIAAAINNALSPLPPKWLPHQRWRSTNGDADESHKNADAQGRRQTHAGRHRRAQ